MRKIESDTWDSGNSLTRFYEVIRECETCHGEGNIPNPEERGRTEICPDCNGQGEERIV